MVVEGAQAPDFTLPGLDGLQYSLHEAAHAGPVLLVFLQAHCGACKMAAPYLNTLHRAYENLVWAFWTIAQDAREDASAFATSLALRPVVLVDGPDLRVSDAYDPESTPAFFFLEPGEGVTLAFDGFDKEGLNEISRRVAAYAGAEYVEVAPADDGNPRFRPG